MGRARRTLLDAAGSLLRDLWEAGASGDRGEVANLLDELGYDLEDDEVLGFRIFAEPDDILGDFYRAWIKTT